MTDVVPLFLVMYLGKIHIWCIFGATYLVQKQEKPSLNILKEGFLLIVLWSIRDSNSSPLDCQSNALAR